eukprot:TRINITY_DN9030_c0_g1_i2.p2 TRINITY_DN9030_c0_g1~~TRINITY_DN9030_c0_g1_i2.p2  ORF type:complete len:126 (+),score=5.47 TRINITY_DN9030_c0_g1_i2:833-1210(+)
MLQYTTKWHHDRRHLLRQQIAKCHCHTVVPWNVLLMLMLMLLLVLVLLLFLRLLCNYLMTSPSTPPSRSSSSVCASSGGLGDNVRVDTDKNFGRFANSTYQCPMRHVHCRGYVNIRGITIPCTLR